VLALTPIPILIEIQLWNKLKCSSSSRVGGPSYDYKSHMSDIDGKKMEKTDIYQLADKLVHKHLGCHWEFIINPYHKKSLGKCVYDRHQIELSGYVAKTGSVSVIKQIILHEIAHALEPIDTFYHSDDFYDIVESIGGLHEYGETDLLMKNNYTTSKR
jgi:hypothetical protein